MTHILLINMRTAGGFIMKRIPIICLVLMVLAGCKFDPSGYPLHEGLVDSEATAETKALYNNLKTISTAGDKILIGHQETTAYGVGWWDAPEDTSDIKKVCGDFPAVYGWDAEGVTGPTNIDGVSFERMRELITNAYVRGGINTFSWHLHNIPNGGTAWDTTADINRILPGGDRHEIYTAELDALANYFLSLRGSNGELIPIIFRPFHENNGNWFWWGISSSTPEQYKSLWRFTVTYLRDVRHLHSLLYAYSPDRFWGYNGYLDRYPGNDWVDILGHDNYTDFTFGSSMRGLFRLKQLIAMAEAFDKIPALTESGSEGVPLTNWWSLFLNPIKMCPESRRIAYVLFWRNANESHHFGPYPGDQSAGDFIKFYNDPVTIFENDLPGMYE
jgi:mannan endo-1,4-beta-mannosidase